MGRGPGSTAGTLPFTGTWRSGVMGRLLLLLLLLPCAITRAEMVVAEVEGERALLSSGVMGEPNRPDSSFSDPDRCDRASSSE